MKTKRKSKNIKIILFCDDPAGGAILSILNDNLSKKYTTFPFFIGPSERYLDLYKFKNNTLGKNLKKKDFEKKIINKKPDLIITASGIYNNSEHSARIVAKKNNIKCISILDYWSEYAARFKRIINKKIEYSFPDWIFAMDKKSTKDFVKETGFNKKNIFISGSLNLEKIKNNLKIYRNKNNKKTINKNNLIITFFSDAFYTKKNNKYHTGLGTCFDKKGNSIFGYTPDIILDKLLKNLTYINKKIKKNITFILKPHPRENYDSLLPIVNRYKAKENKITYKIELNKKSDYLSFKSDLVFGMGSIALFESGFANKPTFSIQIGLNRSKIYDPCIANYFNYSIKVDSENRLNKVLKEYCVNPKSKKFTFPKKNVNFKNALNKTKKKIDNIIESI